MYLPPLVGLVWDWSFCCEYKYLVTWQYKQALAGRAVLTTRKGVGTSVTIRNSSMFVEMIVSLVPAHPKRCHRGVLDGRQPELVALGRTQTASGGDASTGGIPAARPAIA